MNNKKVTHDDLTEKTLIFKKSRQITESQNKHFKKSTQFHIILQRSFSIHQAVVLSLLLPKAQSDRTTSLCADCQKTPSKGGFDLRR